MAVREAMNAASVSIPHADTIVAVGSVTSAVQHWLWTVRSDTRLRDAVAKQVGGHQGEAFVPITATGTPHQHHGTCRVSTGRIVATLQRETQRNTARTQAQ